MTVTCKEISVSVSLDPGAPADQTIRGVLRGPERAESVQLLSHGSTYNRHYWDFPQRNCEYSYVDRAHEAGFATLAIDRLGYGASSHPMSGSVTVDTGAYVTSQLAEKLRNGELGRYRRVIGVGHSSGSVVLLKHAAVHNNDRNPDNDLDLLIATGVTNVKGPSVPALLAQFTPAIHDPRFAASGLDTGYFTTRGGRDEHGNSNRSIFYNLRNADTEIIARDEELKDTASGPEARDLEAWRDGPPESSFSTEVRIPVLLAVGEEDQIYLNSGFDGNRCREELEAFEKPYFPNADLQVITIPGIGHSLNLHKSADVFFGEVQRYIRDYVPE
ncbi:alpha/beta hydrolase [Nocardia sp. NPDC003345]